MKFCENLQVEDNFNNTFQKSAFPCTRLIALRKGKGKVSKRFSFVKRFGKKTLNPPNKRKKMRSMFFICQYPPLAIKALWFNTLMADTAYNITHQPTIRHSLPHRASLRKSITQICLTIYAACSTGNTHYKFSLFLADNKPFTSRRLRRLTQNLRVASPSLPSGRYTRVYDACSA